MALEEEINGDLPTWAKVIYRYGLAAAIAGFLVWFVTQGLSDDVRATRDMLREHIAEQRFYLRAICVNTSQTEIQRAQCVDVERGR